MTAPKGNRFWEVRSSHGRAPIFHDEAELWDAACEYFAWASDNSIEEEQLFAYQGAVTRETCYKMRPMTIQGLCLFLDISRQTWQDYKGREGFIDITARVESVIYEQKFAGAATGLLNPNIIARELGLSDRREVEHGAANSMTALLAQISGATLKPKSDD